MTCKKENLWVTFTRYQFTLFLAVNQQVVLLTQVVSFASLLSILFSRDHVFLLPNSPWNQWWVYLRDVRVYGIFDRAICHSQFYYFLVSKLFLKETMFCSFFFLTLSPFLFFQFVLFSFSFFFTPSLRSFTTTIWLMDLRLMPKLE